MVELLGSFLGWEYIVLVEGYGLGVMGCIVIWLNCWENHSL